MAQVRFSSGSLRFRQDSLDCMVSGASAQTEIAETLRELRRGLAARGHLRLAVERPGRAWAMHRQPRGGPLHTLAFLLNGCMFYLRGKMLVRAGGAFYSERGLRIAMRRAGFVSVRFSQGGEKLVVEARNTLPLEDASAPRESRDALSSVSLTRAALAC